LQFLLHILGLTYALKKIDMSIWAGVGTALITAIGIVYFKEPLTLIKLISITLIIAGVVGLHLSQNMH